MWTLPLTGTGKTHTSMPQPKCGAWCTWFTPSLFLHTGEIPAPLADLPSASSAGGSHPLIQSLWICSGTRSQLDPMLFHQSISVLISSQDPAQSFSLSYLETTRSGEPREEGERDGPKRTLWLYQVGVKMELLKLGPHTSVANAVVSVVLGKVREDLTHQVPTRPF